MEEKTTQDYVKTVLEYSSLIDSGQDERAEGLIETINKLEEFLDFQNNPNLYKSALLELEQVSGKGVYAKFWAGMGLAKLDKKEAKRILESVAKTDSMTGVMASSVLRNLDGEN